MTIQLWGLPNLLACFLLISACDGGSNNSESEPEPEPEDGLVWSDEFNYTGAPDATKWDYDLGAGGWGNNEAQYYTDRQANVVVDGKHLVIRALKEDLGGASYTSTRIVSRGKASFLYGRFEVRAQIPAGIGTWPAIWMLPEEWRYGGWPESGEIDIMEHVGKDQGRVHASLHMGALNHTNGTQTSGSMMIPDATTAFHVYALEWSAEEIRFYFDDRLVGISTNAVAGSGVYRNPNRGPDYWPFDQPFHFLFNIAVGGNWGGPDIDPSAFPATMLIDYVRVYELPE